MDQVTALVAGGKLQPGDVVPSVRQMAADLCVNMMTVSKAMRDVKDAWGQLKTFAFPVVFHSFTRFRVEIQDFAQSLFEVGFEIEQALSVVGVASAKLLF